MLHTLAMGHRDQGRHDAAIAHLTRAREIATATGDEAGIAQHTRGIGACHHAAGRYAEALPYLEQARDLLRPLGQPRDLALTLIILGSSRTALGEPGVAIDLLEEALRLLDTLPGHDGVNTGRALAFLGEAHSAAGGRPEATAHLARALAQFAETGAQHWVARTMLLLGEAARRAGDEKTARIWLNASLGMFQALGRTIDTQRLAELLNGAEGR
ncbi:hypothetical protein GCM10009759_65180 [Kitasatospora saccharophila]|uniref:Tetratricopeptide repeat protein n=1 Tax=Kitasatospora saccharophila TaxID=407973 RepID=A0ABN2XXC1_9ACTN